MTAGFRFRAMAALLRQARVIAVPGWLFTAGSIGWLVLATLGCDGVARVAYGAATTVIVAGLGQAVYAVRLGFDTGLLSALATHDGIEDTAALVDATLVNLALLRPRGQTRDWNARWNGARRLLHRQAACVLLQGVAFATMLITGDTAACWNA